MSTASSCLAGALDAHHPRNAGCAFIEKWWKAEPSGGQCRRMYTPRLRASQAFSYLFHGSAVAAHVRLRPCMPLPFRIRCWRTCEEALSGRWWTRCRWRLAADGGRGGSGGTPHGRPAIRRPQPGAQDVQQRDSGRLSTVHWTIQAARRRALAAQVADAALGLARAADDRRRNSHVGGAARVGVRGRRGRCTRGGERARRLSRITTGWHLIEPALPRHRCRPRRCRRRSPRRPRRLAALASAAPPPVLPSVPPRATVDARAQRGGGPVAGAQGRCARAVRWAGGPASRAAPATPGGRRGACARRIACVRRGHARARRSVVGVPAC